MRDLTTYIFLITIVSIIIGSLFLLPKLYFLSKLNLSDDKYRETNDCELKIEQQQMEIEKYLNIMKLSYLVNPEKSTSNFQEYYKMIDI